MAESSPKSPGLPGEGRPGLPNSASGEEPTPSQQPGAQADQTAQSSSPPSQKATHLTSKELEDVVAEIKIRRTIQLERLQAFADGAVLAAEQVQDKRIGWLEANVWADDSSFYVDLVVYLVAGLVVGTLVNKASKALFSWVVKNQKIAVELAAKSTTSRIVTAQDFKSLQSEVEKSAKVAQLKTGALTADNVKTHFADLALITKTIETPEGLKEVLIADALAKASDKAKKEAEKAVRAQLVPRIEERINEPLVAATDSIGVSLRQVMQSFTRDMRISIEAQTIMFENHVRAARNSIGKQEARSFLNMIAPINAQDVRALSEGPTQVENSPLTRELSYVRARYKLEFEALIWAKLFETAFIESSQPKLKKIGRGELSFMRTTFESTLPPKILEYLYQRFSSQIANWVHKRDSDAAKDTCLSVAGIEPLSGSRDPLSARERNVWWKDLELKELQVVCLACYMLSIINSFKVDKEHFKQEAALTGKGPS